MPELEVRYSQFGKVREIEGSTERGEAFYQWLEMNIGHGFLGYSMAGDVAPLAVDMINGEPFVSLQYPGVDTWSATHIFGSKIAEELTNLGIIEIEPSLEDQELAKTVASAD